MAVPGLGDRAQLFAGQRYNTDIRSRLATLSQEMASGQANDMVAHLKGDTAPLADIDRRLAMADSYGTAAKQAGNRLALMQDTLGEVDAIRTTLVDQLMSPGVAGSRKIAAEAAQAAFDDMAAALNTRQGPNALFSGTAAGGAALSSSSSMMAQIRTAVAGATTAADVATRLDTWFDDPAGGFATSAYLGSDADLTRAVDTDTTVTLGARADDPALRGLLKAAAKGILSNDATLSLADGEGAKLLERSRDDLLSLSAPLTELRAGLGLAQSRVEEATARHTARASAWGIMRNEMTQVDPYATATEVEALRTQLETHYELTSRLSSLSLLSYLR
ncbi:hypothetical protein FHG66_05320 [Rubellimicrobium rubrum]|uniref:Flagellin C-terminal domain-containing protein n=1 Tax=Rubellimicrobium rubrum TaxID=2585369 RepID=A0A5C4N0G7_9RHOB|nr:flagellin [Rubellimicrobium rubrum]TNC51582.1 hypothetical protein FHG66_05320 [Rubellimicrobium rubrum]